MKAIMTALAVLSMSGLVAPEPALGETRSYPVGDIAALEASGGFRVEVVAGEAASVRLTGDADDIDDIRVSAHRGRLQLHYSCMFLCGGRLDVVAYVTVPAMESIAVSKGVEVRVEGVQAQDLRLRASMGGIMSVEGACQALDAEASMGGIINADGLHCMEADAAASMGGIVSLVAQNRVRANASMGGQIAVDGEPAQRHQSAMMGGVVSIR